MFIQQSLEYMIVLFTQVGQVSLWISDKVGFIVNITCLLIYYPYIAL